MNAIRRRKPGALICAILMALSLYATAVDAAEYTTPQVIINSSVELPPGFTESALRSIFYGRMQSWPDGTPVKVFVLPETHPIHKAFCITYLKTFPYVLRNQWDQLTFTGAGIAPTEVATTYQLYEKVRSTPGAIGYSNRLPGNDSLFKFIGTDATPESDGAQTF